MRTIITTTGTSLLGQATRLLSKKPDEITEADLAHVFEQTTIEKACAETNSLSKIADSKDKIILLHTHTTEGKLCAQAVANKLAKDDWNDVELQQIELVDDEAQFERKGLRELVNTLIERITKAQRDKQEVIINATGGYKAQIAYTTMVGTIFQVPVKYIHQNFARPITFPALPVTWNTDLLLQYQDFFSWIDSEPRQNEEVEQRIGYLPDKDAISSLLLSPDEEGYVFLSAAGDVLWGKFRQEKEQAKFAEDPPASEIDNPMDKVHSSLQGVKHHYPKDSLKFAEKVAQIPAVESVIGGRFEHTVLKRIKSIGEDGIIRLLWADNDKAANIIVHTTAKGKAQTQKVADLIEPLLN